MPPGYTITVAISRLVNKALVKITELKKGCYTNPGLPDERAIKDERNDIGQKISGGVYLVLVNNEGSNSPGGKKRTKAKIFLISI